MQASCTTDLPVQVHATELPRRMPASCGQRQAGCGCSCRPDLLSLCREYAMAIGNGLKGKGGTAMVYRSKHLTEGAPLRAMQL